MRLSIKSFRKHEEKIFSFNDLVLVKGNSGLGKSTIFSAIYWCLYGSLKCIYPFSSPNINTSVELEYENLKVKRSRNPRVFTVCLDGKIYKDVEGQGIIDSLFGEKDTWLATSYLEQGQLHCFLSSSSSSSMKILDKLTFAEERPQEFISRIDNTYKELEKEIKIYEKEIKILSVHIKDRIDGVDEKDCRSEEELLTLEKRKKELEKGIETLRPLLLQEKENNGLRKAWLKEKAELCQRKEGLKPIPLPEHAEELLNTWEKEEKRIQERENFLRSYENQEKTRRKIEEEIGILGKDLKLPLSSDVYKLRTSLDKYESNVSLAKSLQIAYDKEIIDKEISRLQEASIKVEEQAILSVLYKKQEDKRKVIEKELFTLGEEKEFSEESLSQLEEVYLFLQEKAKEKERGKEVLLCPHCSGSLRYCSGQLLKSEDKPFSTCEWKRLQEEIALKGREIASLKEERKKNHRRKELRGQLTCLTNPSPGELVPLNVVKGWKTKITSLSKIEYFPPVDYTLSQINAVKKIQELNNSLLNLPKLSPLEKGEDSLFIVSEKLQGLRERKKKLREDLFLYNKREEEKTLLEKSLEKIEKNLEKLQETSYEEEINSLLVEEKLVKEELEKAREANSFRDNFLLYQENIDKYQDTYENMVSLQKLKSNAQRAECLHLENVVDTCNYVLDSICSTIFEEPLSARLSLEKQLKNGQNVHKVNFSISYHGREGDVEQLSGGEKQRLSLALTLALSQFSSSPILLDECLAFLDADLQESCISAIKKFTAGKTVIYIGHNMTEGYFSSSLEL